MFKILTLAAVLALAPVAVAQAQDAPQKPSEAAIEAAALAFEARMETFGARAETISNDASLSDEEKEVRIAAVFAEYQPEIAAFTASITAQASAIAAEALAEIDISALVSEAMAEADVSGALAAAGSVAQNGAWASNDPEHMETYGLMAQYALGQAEDAMDEANTAVLEADQPDAE